jgi:hypothetical protein
MTFGLARLTTEVQLASLTPYSSRLGPFRNGQRSTLQLGSRPDHQTSPDTEAEQCRCWHPHEAPHVHELTVLPYS